MRVLLKQALDSGQIRQIDFHAGLFLQGLADCNSDEVLLASVIAGRAVGEGHICQPLDQVAGRKVFGREIALTAPEISVWREKLLSSNIVSRPDDGNSPLILDSENRLYLARYFRDENEIAEDFLQRSQGMCDVDSEKAKKLLDQLFSAQGDVDWQKQAAALALLKRFVVISGGPGTGKTYTVARILALVQALSPEPLRIALAAPTGKAAFRLQESVAKAKSSLPEELAGMVPDQTLTIHRLLGVVPRTGQFRYNENNPLHLDLLVLDEASMIDVPLMASVIKALPKNARLVMLGDKDQLTSVEAGSLFGDICASDAPVWSRSMCSRLGKLTGYTLNPAVDNEIFGDSVVVLQASYRFSDKSGISELAQAVKSGERERVHDVMQQESYADIAFKKLDQNSLKSWLPERLYQGFLPCFLAASPSEALGAYDNFRVLCAVREGVAGVNGLNSVAEEMFRSRGVIQGNERWYKGKPIMIRVNHYGLQLFNGDTGIVWPDNEQQLWAWFLRQDGSMQKVQLTRLPDHDTAYATTVHKSQGSEFAEVLFVLPLRESRVVNRELIYTGVTRARHKLTICGDPEVLGDGIEHQVVRYSGLRDKLW